MIDLDSLARDANELDPLPASVMRLIDLLSTDDWAIESVIETASLDAALTAKIMRVANSAANSSAAPVTTLKDSTMRLGATTVVKLATGSAIRGYMTAPNSTSSVLAEQDLWRKSVATALAADILTTMSPDPIPQEAFTVALLNDIGRIVLSRYLDGRTSSFLERAVVEGHQSPLEAEREILGVDHAEVGALIAERWHLPSLIADSIRFHHTPDEALDAGVATLCNVITVADAAAVHVVTGGEEAEAAYDYTDSCKKLHLDASAFETLRAAVGERLESTMADYD